MHNTMTLLNRALLIAPIPTWTERLKLSRDAIANAKMRNTLSPVIAAGLAAELGEDPVQWAGFAALENAKSSPAKQAVLNKLNRVAKSVK